MTTMNSSPLIRVSICIPTYNRSACLRELLHSIEQQQRPGLQVVVSNDASPDDTAKVMGEFEGRIHKLRCLTQPSNLGLDLNYQAVARAAEGEFVWMMGDDDRVEPGGVDKVFGLLQQWPGVVGLTLGVLDYDNQLKNVTGVRQMPTAQVAFGVARLFTLIPEHLGFMSALVIRRESWLRVIASDPVHQFHNLYSQVYVIGRAVGTNGAWGVTPELCVAYRSDNDQFQIRMGWFRRLEADVLAYAAIADALLADESSAHQLMSRRILATHVLGRLRNGKLAGLTHTDVRKGAALLVHHYPSHLICWTVALPTLFAPAPILRWSKRLFQRFHPGSGRARARSHDAGRTVHALIDPNHDKR